MNVGIRYTIKTKYFLDNQETIDDIVKVFLF